MPLRTDIEDRLQKVEGELQDYKNKVDGIQDFMKQFLKNNNVKIAQDAMNHKYDEEEIRKRGRVSFTINISPNEPRAKVARTRARRTSIGYGSEGSP